MYRKILVPLDGSLLSERALPFAIKLAKATGAQIILVQCVGVTPVAGIEPGDVQQRALGEAGEYLTDIARDLIAQGLWVETSAPFETAAEGILMEIQVHDADLVVMSTHGRSGLGRWVFGSVAEAVLAHSPVPVALVRAGMTVLTGLEPPQPRLLVPLDGSPLAESALPYAKSLAEALDGVLVLLRVVTPPSAYIPPSPVVPQPLITEETVEQEEADARAYLTDLANELLDEGYRVESVVKRGIAPDIILDESRVPGTEMVVMATHGRTGLARLLFGSVAIEVLRRGTHPVVLVRPVEMREAHIAEHTEANRWLIRN